MKSRKDKKKKKNESESERERAREREQKEIPKSRFIFVQNNKKKNPPPDVESTSVPGGEKWVRKAEAKGKGEGEGFGGRLCFTAGLARQAGLWDFCVSAVSPTPVLSLFWFRFKKCLIPASHTVATHVRGDPPC